MAHAQTSPFKSAGASVHSTTSSRGVRISGSNAGHTMFRGSVKSTDYPLHSPVSPSLPLPCVTVCHHISTGVYNIFNLTMCSTWEANSYLSSHYPRLLQNCKMDHPPLILPALRILITSQCRVCSLQCHPATPLVLQLRDGLQNHSHLHTVVNGQLGSNLCRLQIGSLDEGILIRNRNTCFILIISRGRV
jgi:hypothetical protein